MSKRRALTAVTLVLVLLAMAQFAWAGGQGEGKPPLFAFVTNGVNDFWILSQRGVEQAQKDFPIKTEIRTPPNGTMAEQKSICEDLIAKGAAGIAITVIDPPGMTPFLDSIAKNVILVTHDSDADKSARICYIGTNNYSAGHTMGKLIKEVLPNGGEVMLQVGKLDIRLPN